MSQALQRFNHLRIKFRAAIPARKLSFEQHRALSLAASLQQISEAAVAEMILSGEHDRGLIERFRSEARDIIAAASGLNSKRRREI